MKKKFLLIYEHIGMFANDSSLEAELAKHGINFDPIKIISDHPDTIGILETDQPAERLEAIFSTIVKDGTIRGGCIDVYPLERHMQFELQAG